MISPVFLNDKSTGIENRKTEFQVIIRKKLKGDIQFWGQSHTTHAFHVVKCFYSDPR